MPNQNQNSIISYAPQPYFIGGSSTIVGYDSVSAVENSAGIFDPDLSNYTTVEADSGVAEFAVQVDFDKQSAHLATSNISLGLIGCSLLTYADSGGSPDLSTEFPENITCYMSSNLTAVAAELISFAHNSQDNVYTFNRTPMPSIISGGRSNLLFTGLGVSAAGSSATVYLNFARAAADVAARPHAVLLLGHLFVGVDLPIVVEPRTFSWKLEVENERFRARDFGAINADGTLVKRAFGEIKKITNYLLSGSEITAISPAIVATLIPNLYDLVKVNTSYPLLFNPFPTALITAAAFTIDDLNLSARQNFFSIYGFLEDPIELQPGEYRDGLDSEYRARFRIQETR